MNRGDTVKNIINSFLKLFSYPLLSLILLLISTFMLTACQRNNQSYGGVKELDDAPKYETNLEVNKPVSKP